MERDLDYKVYGSGKDYAYVIGGDGKELSCLFPSLTVVEVIPASWEDNLSPWKSNNPFKNGKEFAGGGEAFLRSLESLVGRIEEREKKRRIVAGYSMGGLFSLYSATLSSLFPLVASVSGSLWFPYFPEYLSSSEFHCRKAYISLGNKEAKTKNPILSSVLEKTREVASILEEKGTKVEFVMEDGGHFSNESGRMERAIRSLLEGESD